MMLADDTAPLAAALASSTGAEVVVVLDNCGLELIAE